VREKRERMLMMLKMVGLLGQFRQGFYKSKIVTSSMSSLCKNKIIHNQTMRNEIEEGDLPLFLII